MKMPIPPQLFGKDHWSTFAYIETRVVDHKGILNSEHLRFDGSKYPTRLNDGSQLNDHNDYDCIDDLEDAGLLLNFGTGIQPLIELTDRGRKVAADLRKHKAEGKNFADFEYKE